MVRRSLALTALASLLALGTQAAFAEPNAADAASTGAAPAAVSNSAQSGSQAAVATPATKGRTRHAARIPGTFDPTDAAEQNLAILHVTFPALSGDSGG